MTYRIVRKDIRNIFYFVREDTNDSGEKLNLLFETIGLE